MLFKRKQDEGAKPEESGPKALGSKLAGKVTSAPGPLIENVPAAQSELGDKVAQSELGDKVSSAGRSGLAGAGRGIRDLGQAISPKRWLNRAAMAAALALMRRNLGVVGAGAGTLVLAGTAGYFAGRRSRRKGGSQ